MLNIEDIRKVLPHRFPFLLIDRIVELDPNVKVVALKNVSYNEDYFSGHFPGQPVMPGVLIIEAMAQASIMLLYGSKNKLEGKKLAYYLGSTKIRFSYPVTPGDQLMITIEPVKMVSMAGIVKATARVGDKEVASGELSFAAKEL